MTFHVICFHTTKRGGQLGWRLFSFSDGVFYLTHVLVERLRVIFIDYNYQYLAKCQSLYLVLFLIIYIGGDETILCTICILPPGFLFIPMEHMFYEKKKNLYYDDIVRFLHAILFSGQNKCPTL